MQGSPKSTMAQWKSVARGVSTLCERLGFVPRRGPRRRHRQRMQPVCGGLETLESRCVLTVVISEFMAANDTTLADDEGEFSDWIELHNTGTQAVNLQGWHLTDNVNNLAQWDFPAVTMQPDQYLVVFASGKDRVDPAKPLHTNFKLSTDGEYLALVQSDSTTVEFAYAPQFPPQSADVSYGLSTDGSDRGFFVAPTPGTANATPIPDSSKAVVISEMMYSLPRETILDAEDTSLEYIEIHNRGLSAIDVTRWQFTKGVDFTFPQTSIPAGGMLVVAADTAAFTAAHGNLPNVVGGWVGRLSNSGETIELVDAGGNLVDRVEYFSDGDWATRTLGPDDQGWRGWIWTAGHDGGGKSLELINRNMSNDNGQNWTSSLVDGGTPGAINSVDATNIAPIISDVAHAPLLPHADETVTVTARMADDSSAAVTATVFWRANATGNFSAVTMFDDGAHGDGAAGDGQFGATLPAQSDRTVVEFYVRSQDVTGRQRTWPAPTTEGQVANALYQVLNAYDDSDVSQPGSPAIYHVIMTPADRTEFDSTGPRDPHRQSDAQFNATFIAITPSESALALHDGCAFSRER